MNFHNVDIYNYNLPEELIAYYPSARRETSRMLVLDRETGNMDIRPFSEINSFLRPTDCLVLNNTKVMKCRLFGKKEGTLANVEVMLLSCISDNFSEWLCLLKPGKRVKPGVKVFISPKSGNTLSEIYFKVISSNKDGSYVIDFAGVNAFDIMGEYGHVPLPPYIRRKDDISDEERYQTVYSTEHGAVAAPTAGLHFTHDILAGISKKGVNIAELTLHVGAGTFKPVKSDDIREHQMHSEQYFIDELNAEKINSAKRVNNRVAAVGTTSVRVLESVSDNSGLIKSCAGWTDIFIYPPYKFKAVDIMLTNFHLPESTLLMLVSAFAGIDRIKSAYSYAIENKMRFFSYGDCMLIIQQRA